MGQKREAAKAAIQDMDLSKTPEFTIHGPWSFRGLHELEAPLYHFLPGGEKEQVGRVVASTSNGLLFEIELHPDFADVDQASFEMPMRFNVKRK